MMLLWIWAAAIFVSNSAQAAEARARYDNVQYHDALDYPSARFVPQGEPDAGDGQEFRARDGGVLRVFAFWNVLGKSMDQEAADQEAGGVVAYRAAGRDWRVVSGTTGDGRIFYLRILHHEDGAYGEYIVTELSYPARLAGRYKSIAARLAGALSVWGG